jgi:rhodanese-related sulfurtransferase
MKTTLRLPLSLAALFLLGYFSKAQAQFASGQRAYSEMQAGQAIILDVREKNEVSEGMVRGSHWVALSDLNSHPTETIQKIRSLANDAKIYIYCRSGSRSEKFIDSLRQHQLNGLNLGGYESLIKQGLPSQPKS